MRVILLCVGRLSRTFASVSEHYLGLLRPYATVKVHEAPEAPASLGRVQVLAREAETLSELMRPEAFTVALDRCGRQLPSEDLSALLADKKVHGHSGFQFILGGALGLDQRILDAADFRWSLSELTFPHQFARCIVLEQLYRAVRIERGEPYHH